MSDYDSGNKKNSSEEYYAGRGVSFDDATTRTVSSKESIRLKLEEDMQNFLNKGGAVQAIQDNVTADPPRKPVSNYGSRPI